MAKAWRICQVDEARPQIRGPTHGQEGAHAHLCTLLVVMLVSSMDIYMCIYYVYNVYG